MLSVGTIGGACRQLLRSLAIRLPPIRRLIESRDSLAADNKRIAAQCDALHSEADAARREVDAVRTAADAVRKEADAVRIERDELYALCERRTAERDRLLAQRAIAQRGRAKPIHCVFLAQLPEVWPSWQSLWVALMRDPQFVVTVVAVPYLLFGYRSGELENFLISEGIPFVPEKDFDFGGVSIDVVFVQNPYDVARPERFHTENLIRAVPRIAYIPYALDIGGGKENQSYQFDLPLQRKAWRIFVRSERHKRMFARYCTSGDRHVVVTGHPRVDLLCQPPQYSADRDVFPKLGNRPVLLWNPHFAVLPGNCYSTFLKWKELMLRLAAERAQLGFIVRPHPLLRGFLSEKKIMTASELNTYFSTLGSLPNVVIDEGTSYLEAFARSSAMISDISSFLLEYLLTGKPVLYLRSADTEGLNDDGDVVDNYDIADTEEQIVSFIDAVAAGKDALRERRKAAIAEYFFRPDGCAGERIRDFLFREIHRERFELSGPSQ